jgi:hypothetical protein
MDTHVLQNVAIPEFSPKKKAHQRLSELSKAAHKATEEDDRGRVRQIEEEIDQLAAEIWTLSNEELAEIRRSLEEARG